MLEVTDRIEGFELPRGASLGDYSLVNDGHDYDSDFEPDEEEDDEDADIVVVKRDCSDDLPLQTHQETLLINDSPADSLVMQDSLIQNSIHSDLDGKMQFVIAFKETDLNASFNPESVQSTTGSFRLVHHKREEGSHLYSYSSEPDRCSYLTFNSHFLEAFDGQTFVLLGTASRTCVRSIVFLADSAEL